jgi:hypothetical protein
MLDAADTLQFQTQFNPAAAALPHQTLQEMRLAAALDGATVAC